MKKTNKIEQKKIIEEYTNHLQRLQADFENYIKKSEKEKQEFTKYATHKLLSKLITITDDLEIALKLIEKEKHLKQGFEIIFNNLKKTIEKEGVKEIKALGKRLDPYKHEVIDFIQGKEDNIIIEELQKGYQIHDKILRPTKVRISKRSDNIREDKNVSKQK